MKNKFKLCVIILLSVIVDGLSQSKIDFSATLGINLLESKVDFDSNNIIDVKKIPKNVINFGANYHWNKLLQVNIDLTLSKYYTGFCENLNVLDNSGTEQNITTCGRTDYSPAIRFQTGIGIKIHILKSLQIIPVLGGSYSVNGKERHPQFGFATVQYPNGKTFYAETHELEETLKNIIHINFGLNLKLRLYSFINAIIKTSYNLGINTITIYNIKYSYKTEVIENSTTESIIINDDVLEERANVSSKFSGFQISFGVEIPLKF